MRLLLLSLCLIPYVSAAHTLWLQPRPAARKGKTEVTLRIGDPLQKSDAVNIGARERYSKALLVGRDGKKDLLKQLLLKGQPVLFLDSPAAGESYLVGLESTARESVLPAAKFESYLLEERLIDILAMRAEEGTEDAPGRERYFRCVKALIGEGGMPSPVVTAPMGQELEIVPLDDPRSVKKGQPMRFRILLRGQPLARRAVTAARRQGDKVEVRRVRSGKDGVVAFDRTGEGDWLISLVHMEVETFPGYDWRSLWSSFFFSLKT